MLIEFSAVRKPTSLPCCLRKTFGIQEGMLGLDSVLISQFACRAELLTLIWFTSLRANVLTRVKTAFANAFAVPSFATAVA